MSTADTSTAATKRNLEIVIIDDDPITCTVQEFKIKSKFSQPLHVFQDARKALNFLSTAAPTNFLVLLDIDMPEMDGFEFLTEWQCRDARSCVSTSASEIKVIMLSCSINTMDKERSQTYPQVADYIEKPLYNSHLGLVEEVIDSF